MNDKIIQKCEKNLKKQFEILEDIALDNQEKVLKAFQKNQIALRHFSGSSGYGYGDEGRDKLNQLFADIFGAEMAICSPNIVSGTHAISLALYGVLRPNNKVLAISGTPYDTLLDVIYKEGVGSLKDYGVTFDCIPLKNDKIDYYSVEKAINENMPDMIYIQRSRGYELRDPICISEIKKAVEFVRNLGFNGCIFVDNCYGEFVEKLEPTDVGASVIAGSLIKNPGGGIAFTGGYVAGDAKYIELIQNRLTAPSIGGEVGSYQAGYQTFFQGVFMAPHVVLQALKGSLLFGAVLSELGYKTSPEVGKIPYDITRSIMFNDRDKLISFIQSIQKNSPIDSHVSVMPWEMPGYTDEVIMAAGCFVQGASIELSADAPVKPPYIAYLQGGITYEHCKIAIKNLDI